ncbi:uncharacterized protein HaLaN_20865, partial [Haematococcus lacustris]
MLGLLVGSVADMLTSASAEARNTKALRAKMTEVDEWLIRRHLPSRTRRQIHMYYTDEWTPGKENPLESQILHDLPLALRTQTVVHMTQHSLTALPLVSGLVWAYTPWMADKAKELVLTALAAHMEPLQIASGHVLCRDGDLLEGMWVLTDGQLAAV